MKHPLKITALSLAAVGLIGLGIWSATAARAETATPAVDTQVSADSVASTATATAPSTTVPPADRHQERLTEMAQLLGITPDQLQTELDSGKEFYQIAAEHGVTYDKLLANRNTAYQARLNDMVKVGFLTQDEANTMYQQFQTQSQQMPMFGMGFGHGMRGLGLGM